MASSFFKKRLSPIKPGDPIDYKDIDLLKKFITERGKLLPRRMTGLTAGQFGLTDRGVIREGAFADIVIFDPETIAERATFERPKEPAAGISHVMVNGQVIREGGAWTGARPGRALRRQGA